MKTIILLVAIILISIVALVAIATVMPGQSWDGPLPALDQAGEQLRDKLQKHVQHLSVDIGKRNVWKAGSLDRSKSYIVEQLKKRGYEVDLQCYEIGRSFCNIQVTIPGKKTSDEIVIVGAHYDTVFQSPGANDNGSGVAALLELARLLYDVKPQREIRLVTFVNEEEPFAENKHWMGSLVYAGKSADKEENIVAMLSLETIGYYTDAPSSQNYPPLLNFFYPDRGNFIAFVGNLKSRSLVRQSVGQFRRTAKFPSEGLAAPGLLEDIRRSDHSSFWAHGYPALMVTDTANLRSERYHDASDTIDSVDFDRVARVVTGLHAVISDLGGVGQ